jgi:hypothetical protein
MYYNVLPQEVKKTLKKEYKLRLLTVLFFGLTAVALIAFVSFIPSYIAVSIKESQAKTAAETLNQLGGAQNSGTTGADVFLTGEEIKLLQANAVSHVPSDLLSKLLEGKPTGVSIDNIVYEFSNGKGKLTVSGSAGTRDDLLLFRDQIQKTAPFEKVNLPVAILAKDTNVSFSIAISGSF